MVVTGAAGVGKTTFVRTSSQATVIATDRQAADGGSTTVGMDLGRIGIADDLVLHLVGTPGGARFVGITPSLCIGAIGHVLLVDATRPETVAGAADLLASTSTFDGRPFVVAVNRAVDGTSVAAEVRDRLSVATYVPILPVDVRDRPATRAVLSALLGVVRDCVTARPRLGEVAR